MMIKIRWWLICSLLCYTLPYAYSGSDTHDLAVNIKEIEDRMFATQASFKLPLKHCQAWRYLTQYESSSAIPGVLSAKVTRVDHNKARVELIMEERILFLKVHMNSVLEFLELPNRGTNFEQVSGDAKLFQGTWRIEPSGTETIFRYNSVFKPDSALPMVVIEYFFNRHLRSNFAAIASKGASQRDVACP